MKRPIPLILFILIFFSGQHAFATSYEAILLGDLGDNYSQVYSGINNSGDVVGQSDTASGNTHAFYYDGYNMTDIKPSGGSYISARGINDAGQIVGIEEGYAFLYDPISSTPWSVLTSAEGSAHAINKSGNVVGRDGSKAFFYDGTMHDIGDLGGGSSLAYDVNDSNVVVGYSSTGSATHAFLYNANAAAPVMIDIGSSLGNYNQANSINNDGYVVGDYITTAFSNMAALYDGSEWTSLGALSDLGGGLSAYTNSSARGINDNEYVVGFSYDTSLNRLATLWYGGSIYNLNDLIVGWVGLEALGLAEIPSITLIEAWDINSSGQIAANAFIGDNHYAFLINPVPEPSTMLLLIPGVVGLISARKRFRKA